MSDSDSDTDFLPGARPLREIPGETLMVDAEGLFDAVVAAVRDANLSKEQRAAFLASLQSAYGARLSQLEARLASFDSDVLHKAGAETATGVKTFADGIATPAIIPIGEGGLRVNGRIYIVDAGSDSDSDAEPTEGDLAVTLNDIWPGTLYSEEVASLYSIAYELSNIYDAVCGSSRDTFVNGLDSLFERCGVDNLSSSSPDTTKFSADELNAVIQILLGGGGADGGQTVQSANAVLDVIANNLLGWVKSYIDDLLDGQGGDGGGGGGGSDSDSDTLTCEDLLDLVEKLEAQVAALEEALRNALALKNGLEAFDSYIARNGGNLPNPVVEVDGDSMVTAFEDLVFKRKKGS